MQFGFALVAVLISLMPFPTYADLSREVCTGTTVDALKRLEPEFSFKAYAGIEITHGPFDASDFKANTIHELGSGIGGGDVFRLTDKQTGRARVIKIYHRSANLESDERAFAEYPNLLKGETVRVARHKRLSDNRMEIENIEGVTVQSLHQDHNASFELRSKIWEQYSRLSKSVEAKVKTKYEGQPGFTFTEGKNWWMAFFTNSAGERIKIAMKADNILVDAKTLEFILIDPL